MFCTKSRNFLTVVQVRIFIFKRKQLKCRRQKKAQKKIMHDPIFDAYMDISHQHILRII